MNNPERINQVRTALRENQWDLIVCALPMNVLLLSGYWPVVGTGVAVASPDGRISLLVPEDEEEIAKRGWADEVRTFKPGSLDRLTTAAEAIQTPLRTLAQSFSTGSVRVGFEAHATSEPASYAAMHLYNGTMRPLLDETFSISTLTPADEALAGLRSRKTDCKINKIRTACQIAGKAFRCGFELMEAGTTELETAATFRELLSVSLVDFRNVERFGPQFKHSTGHGVGFSAISANAKPRLHPKSTETLETGMVFNVEPAIYFEGYGGIRHCDMVTVTEAGAELLTPFQCGAGELRLDPQPAPMTEAAKL